MAGSSSPVQPEERIEPFEDRPQPHTRLSPAEFDEKNVHVHPPTLDTFSTLQPNDSVGDQARLSPSAHRADASRLDDDLELLRAERLVSNQSADDKSRGGRKARPEPEDAFNQPGLDATPEKKRDVDAALFKFWVFLKKFPRFIRYTVYLFPGAALLLIPVLLGYFVWDDGQNAVGGNGGVYVMWFGIWLEIIWGSLWVSRMVTSLMPPMFQTGAKLAGSINHKKWRDIGQQLELHTALFLWWLAILVSYSPTMEGHRAPVPKGEEKADDGWIDILQKVIIAIFVLAVLNWAEKILIQWIATSFHQRTYATRIENNKADTRQLVHLYEYAKSHLAANDPFFNTGSASGAQTPMRAFQNNAKQVWGKVGNVANRVGNDIIGRKSSNSNHPRRIVAELLRNTLSAHTLARLIYRSLVREDREMVFLDDMQRAFVADQEAEAAFGVFDKDLNGDISLEEFEAVCNEIHLEKKAIAASLKDLDSVIQKLDNVFLVVIIFIAIIVFISIFSASSAAALASAGSAILGLAWVLQATAQEFLQSIIFVFVKHPFDVGDRVTVYGSTGANMTGDDYYVTEISLLYTEFKKMEGHIVQAPNSALNTVFILNHRRSNGLADVVSLRIRFGTPGYLIEELKAQMLQFCMQNKRDYQSQIISEVTSVEDCRVTNINVIFFHKSSFQNELLRLTRHNAFLTELQQQMVAIGIQGPMRIDPGGSRDYPMFWAGMQPPPAYGKDQDHDNWANPSNSQTSIQSPQPGVGLHHNPSTASSRKYSVDRMVPSIQAAMGSVDGFQDVFEQRKDTTQAQRLASIREKEAASEIEAESEARASTSALDPESAAEATGSRSRIFGRARSKSKSQQNVSDVV